MPIYEYECVRCGEFEVNQRITEEPLKRCPKCRSKVRKLISNTSFQLKGGGWYVTDYGAGAKKSESKGESKSSESSGSDSTKSSGSDSTKSESGKSETATSESKKDSSSSSTKDKGSSSKAA
jgi:putative FmdB family regulatory protein